MVDNFVELFETMPDVVLVVNESGKIILANAQAEVVFRFSRAELLTMSVDMLIPQRFRQGHEGHRRGYIEQPKVRRMGAGLALFALRKGGEEFPVEISLSPIEREGQRLTIASVRDISDYKRLEHELQALNQGLELKVQQRTAELEATNSSLQEVLETRGQLYTALLSAQEDERGRIARDLHDSIGQSLTAILLHIVELEKDLKDRQLEHLITMLAQALDDVRKISHELRPPLLDALGLEAALQQLARKLSEQSNLSINVLCFGLDSQHIERSKEIAVYRITQEALTNTIRHAQASEVSVVLSLAQQRLQLSVEDNGQGFDVAHEKKGHLGLVGMRERAELIGGECLVESSLGQGTTVYVRLPLHS